MSDPLFQAVFAGALPPCEFGPLTFYRPLPLVVIGVDAAGGEHACLVSASAYLGTTAQVVNELHARTGQACSCQVEDHAMNPARAEAWATHQLALRDRLKDRGVGDGVTELFADPPGPDVRLRQLLMTMRTPAMTIPPDPTAAQARELAAELVAWADRKDRS